MMFFIPIRFVKDALLSGLVPVPKSMADDMCHDLAAYVKVLTPLAMKTTEDRGCAR
jgi:hypothetical protein